MTLEAVPAPSLCLNCGHGYHWDPMNLHRCQAPVFDQRIGALRFCYCDGKKR